MREWQQSETQSGLQQQFPGFGPRFVTVAISPQWCESVCEFLSGVNY